MAPSSLSWHTVTLETSLCLKEGSQLLRGRTQAEAAVVPHGKDERGLDEGTMGEKA